MRLIKKYILFALIISALLFFGYSRDLIFKSINKILQSSDHHTIDTLPRFLQFLENYDHTTLLNIKWLLTILFSLIYLAITIIAIQLLFKNKKYIRIIFTVYIVIILISALFIGLGLLFKNTSETMYEFARYLMGIAQSPIVLMILIPAFKLSEKEEIKD